MKRTGVVVVTYNSGDVIGSCLDSIAAYCPDAQVVVVDNASEDGTVDAAGRAGVRLIANQRNRGFAEAVNQGVLALDCETVILLNPDVELMSAPDALVTVLQDAGIAGGKLLDANGNPQAGFAVRRFPTPWTLAFEVLGLNRLAPWNPVNRRYRCLDLDLDRPADVHQPPGAMLAFRRDLWERLGGFDPVFHPVWFEDVDFCKRARDLGVRIRYIPEVVAKHRGGHSFQKVRWCCREVYWYASLLRYASKHFQTFGCSGVSLAVVLGSIFRSVIGLVQRRSLRPIRVYGQVLGMAARCMFYGRVDQRVCLAGYEQGSGVGTVTSAKE
jgi:GT2 family glycosyltransferase